MLVVHSLNSLHYDIGARSIFLSTDGTVKLIAFGAAKAGLRARHEVDDAEPWLDLAALARTLYEAMTGQAVFDERILPSADVPQPLFDLFRRMIDQSGARGLRSVFEYRHALACVEIEAEKISISSEEANIPIQDTRPIAQQKRPNEPVKDLQPVQKRNLFERTLDAVGDAVSTEQNRSDVPSDAKDETHLKKKIGYLYAGIVLGALVLALILRGLIH